MICSDLWIYALDSIKCIISVLLLYMVPAFLYCLYNNLAFINLKEYDPTTYFILLQLRVMVTGVLFQLIFKKYLSGKQWFSLCLLTVGCVVKIFSNADSSSTGSDHKHIMNFVFCSCLAGVYNEKLLKHFGNAGVGTLPQNIYMCFNSILFNAIALCFIEDVSKAFSRATLLQIWNVNVVIIILNNAAVGIVTAFFLKSLNSIMKNYASALELIFTAILSWIIFGIKIGIWTILSITLVIYATFLYLENPVVNVPAPDLDKEDH
ncbi:CMP-sialic acid transporter 3, partial [Armadillidium nasatum]